MVLAIYLSLLAQAGKESTCNAGDLGSIPEKIALRRERYSLQYSGLENSMDCIVSALCSAKSLQSCPTLCDPIDGSPPGSPVPGILQARTLEWVAISFSNACIVYEVAKSRTQLSDFHSLTVYHYKD